MENEDLMAIWNALVGESDDDEEDFHGFTLEEMTKGEESDVDLDMWSVVEFWNWTMSCRRTIPVTMVEEMKEKAPMTMIICLYLLQENVNKPVSRRPRKPKLM